MSHGVPEITRIVRAAQARKASWILHHRLNGRAWETLPGRCPELSLKDARERARQDRARIERGIGVAALGLWIAVVSAAR